MAKVVTLGEIMLRLSSPGQKRGTFLRKITKKKRIVLFHSKKKKKKLQIFPIFLCQFDYLA